MSVQLAEPATCATAGCLREARMALLTSRRQRDTLKTTVWYDDRTAPKAAARHCKAHGAELVAALTASLVADDAR
jgi:hypothetical protein